MNRGLGGLRDELRDAAVRLYGIARSLNRRAYVSSVVRSRREQEKLYARYKTGRSRYPAAAPGTSKHERGLAFDLGGLSAAQLRKLGKLWTSWGGRWGGEFHDAIHFETR